MSNHVLKIEPYSEAEEYFINELMSICKDRVSVRLGTIFRLPWNEYEITHDDFIRIRDYIKSRDES